MQPWIHVHEHLTRKQHAVCGDAQKHEQKQKPAGEDAGLRACFCSVFPKANIILGRTVERRMNYAS